MQLKIKNALLGKVMDLLYPLALKGKQSRHRTRLINLLRGKLEQVTKEELELLKEYTGTDEEGNPNKDDNGNFAVKDIEGFRKDQSELFSETFVIDGGDMQETLETVKEILLNYDGELSGEEAEIYDYLCEQLEERSAE